MTPERYARITNLCTVLAILSALLFDRVPTLRALFAVVGGLAAVGAMTAYYLREKANKTGSQDGQAFSAPAVIEDTTDTQETARPVNTIWYVHDTTTAHDVVHHDAFHELSQDNVLLFEPGAVKEFLASPVIVGNVEIQQELNWGHVGSYEILITDDGLFALRQARGKRYPITVIGARLGHRHREGAMENALMNMTYMKVAKSG